MSLVDALSSQRDRFGPYGSNTVATHMRKYENDNSAFFD